MIVNIECGFLTPPFGLNLFVSMAIMKSPSWMSARPFCRSYFSLSAVSWC